MVTQSYLHYTVLTFTSVENLEPSIEQNMFLERNFHTSSERSNVNTKLLNCEADIYVTMLLKHSYCCTCGELLHLKKKKSTVPERRLNIRSLEYNLKSMHILHGSTVILASLKLRLQYVIFAICHI